MRQAHIAFSHGPSFYVDAPETPAEMQQGFRGRPEPTYRGMLFDFGSGVVPSMTMEGVPFPLDMVFIAADGRLIGVLPHVPPNTPGPWTCHIPARWVLEVRANAASSILPWSGASIYWRR